MSFSVSGISQAKWDFSSNEAAVKIRAPLTSVCEARIKRSRVSALDGALSHGLHHPTLGEEVHDDRRGHCHEVGGK